MEEGHWGTAKQVIARLPIEDGDRVLDLGTGSGYAARAMRDLKEAGRAYGLDGAPTMARNARSYTDDPNVGYVLGDFGALPFADDAIDHVFSMEALYYASDPHETLADLHRVIRPGGAFYCAVDYYEESIHTHEWDEYVDAPMTRWSRAKYRQAFREAGFHVAEQDTVPDRDVDIPPASEFPTEEWDSREAMIDRYRTHGTLLTVGVVP
ncbi:SAM-dependent methyltransferase [Halobacteriales archaeon SW_7_68_16]|nr:MAG: SAM-dependent methyltransferase [Halobacteriales archaeon SW_7_68_16]